MIDFNPDFSFITRIYVFSLLLSCSVKNLLIKMFRSCL